MYVIRGFKKESHNKISQHFHNNLVLSCGRTQCNLFFSFYFILNCGELTHHLIIKKL